MNDLKLGTEETPCLFEYADTFYSYRHVETVNHCNTVITAKTINTFHSFSNPLPSPSLSLPKYLHRRKKEERNKQVYQHDTSQIRTPPPLNEVKFVQSFIDQVKQSKAYRDPFFRYSTP
ncbi:hypothetical protein EYC80_005881 [Monilinia laxa]|uniref:Uncharacterized protein n=1 Tax=Monilinia laxa TaxID=61186 RepID=A0A5N6KFC5_MONLA|nr:hypothetical protein EYC80_005881 [Monilinia laxa]